MARRESFTRYICEFCGKTAESTYQNERTRLANWVVISPKNERDEYDFCSATCACKWLRDREEGENLKTTACEDEPMADVVPRVQGNFQLHGDQGWAGEMRVVEHPVEEANEAA